jgi:hypothetical protein
LERNSVKEFVHRKAQEDKHRKAQESLRRKAQGLKPPDKNQDEAVSRSRWQPREVATAWWVWAPEPSGCEFRARFSSAVGKLGLRLTDIT